jgi:arylsulfatase A-like enzyme
MKTTSSSTALLAAAIVVTVSGISAFAESPPPNIVFIFADDLGYGDLGCYGATKLQTPNIDRLARQGRRFTDAHSASAVCTPSRYALLTGEYPLRKNLSRPVFLKTGLVIDTNQQTIGTVMKEAGYATACIGKWHLGFGEEAPNWNGDLKPGPLEVGFDYYFGVPVVNSHPPFVYVENHRVVGLVPEDPFVFGRKAKTREYPEKMGIDQIGGADAAHALYDDEAVGTRLLEKSVEWIKVNKDQPFFLYLATTNIHHPFTPAKRFQSTSQCGRYGDFVHELDWMVGEVMKSLEEQGVAENTLVIFTSDNGGMFNIGGQDAWDARHRLNGELLGFKFGAWEGGHRVPFIARWPGRIEAGSTSDQLICNIDMIATLAALTGVAIEEGQGRDSVNILPALTGDPEEPLRDHVVLAANRPTHLALRQGKWVYIGARGSGGFTGAKRGGHAFGGPAAISYAGYVNSDIENGRIKKDAPPAQLYDLEADVRQTKNLYREYPEVVARLKTLLDEYCELQQTAQIAEPASTDAGHGKAGGDVGCLQADRRGVHPTGRSRRQECQKHWHVFRPGLRGDCRRHKVPVDPGDS